MLNGKRSETTRIFGNTTPPRTYLDEVAFIPEHFKAHGYFTARVGKIAHGLFEDAVSWPHLEKSRWSSSVNRPPRLPRAGSRGSQKLPPRYARVIVDDGCSAMLRWSREVVWHAGCLENASTVWRPHNMINRRELEGLIELGVTDLYNAEIRLAREYELLSSATEQEHRTFLASLHDLKRRARLVETLLEALKSAASFKPIAA